MCATPGKKPFARALNSGQLLRPRTEFRLPTNPTQTWGKQGHSSFEKDAHFEYE